MIVSARCHTNHYYHFSVQLSPFVRVIGAFYFRSDFIKAICFTFVLSFCRSNLWWQRWNVQKKYMLFHKQVFFTVALVFYVSGFGLWEKVCLKCEVGFISICSSIVPTVVHTLDYHTVRCHLRISFELIYLVTEDNVLNKDGRPTGLVTVTAIVRDRLKNWTWRKNNNLLKNLFFYQTFVPGRNDDI